MLLFLLTTVHVLVCLFLIVVVLLQSGQAADLAGAFGGMGSQTAFGPRGSATMLSRATTASAVLFMITSLALSIMATRNVGTTGGSTVLDKTKAPVSAPAKPNPNAPRPGEKSGGSFPVPSPQSGGGTPAPAQSQPKK